MRIKCPNCKECLDHRMIDNQWEFICWFCGIIYKMLPGKGLVVHKELKDE